MKPIGPITPGKNRCSCFLGFNLKQGSNGDAGNTNFSTHEHGNAPLVCLWKGPDAALLCMTDNACGPNMEELDIEE